jgi:hypothetical protein
MIEFGTFTRRRLIRAAVLMAVLLGMVVPAILANADAGTAAPRTGKGSLTATLLPAVGDAGGTQLAVSWRGPSDARLDVTLRQGAGPAATQVAGRALSSGVNLMPLRLRPGADGVLRLQARDGSGAVLATLDRSLAGLREAAGFAWESTFSGPGLDASVNAAVVFDDGNGPALYVGGEFLTAGTQVVNRVARWDGTAWAALTGSSGTGVNNLVLSLTVFDGNLIVGGNFTQAGGISANGVARWDGSDWFALGTGVSAGGSGAFVDALATFDGDLIAGGNFIQAGGVAVNQIARWDGAAWSALGNGVSAGTFGTTVGSLAVFDGDLIVGGNFTVAGNVPANNIARWDGTTWAALGAGLTFQLAPRQVAVQALAVYNGALIAGGFFDHAGTVTTNFIARWDGTSWSSLGAGMDRSVSALTVFDGDLIAGGTFVVAGDVTANFIARWDGTAWSVLSGPEGTGLTSGVGGLAVFGGDLIAAGAFAGAGGAAVHHVASWDGTAWAALAGPATGLTAGVTTSIVADVQAMTVFNGELVVGGNFRRAGGDFVFGIASWDGTSWSPLTGSSGTGVLGGLGTSGTVFAMTVFGGDLIVGGSFLAAGGISTGNIARWDGSEWSTLATGTNGTVNALTTFSNRLIAGGSFTQAGTTAVSNIAAWNGSTWAPLGNGTNGPVNALSTFSNRLIAGGSFTQAGTTAASRIAAWNGSTWAPLGTGTNGPVNALTTYNGQLIAGGSFTQAGTAAASRIAAWNGTTWAPLGAGIDGGFSSVRALLPFDADGTGPAPAKLAAGGSFVSTSGVANWALGLFGPQ